MKKVLAEIRIENIGTSFIHISKSPQMYEYIKQNKYEDRGFNLLLRQGFVWYQDFIEFSMLSDFQSYWIKIAVAETLEIDSVIADAIKRPGNSFAGNDIIVLPFKIEDKDKVYVFGDYEEDLNLSFTLPAGNYKLLFQNRDFTPEEIEASPNNDCQDLDYDDWDENMELCLLTFIPTEEVVEPEILVYRSSTRKVKSANPLILFNEKLYEDYDE